MPATTDPGCNAARLVSADASTAGCRTTGSATVVASVSGPASAATAASAPSPSSHGRRHRKWSLAATVSKPVSRAVRT
jgi:hypothetical protein